MDDKLLVERQESFNQKNEVLYFSINQDNK